MILKKVADCLPPIYDGKLVNIWISDFFLSKSSAFKKLILKTIYCDLDI